MKQFFYFIVVVFSCNIALAKPIYITDSMNFNLRSGEGRDFKLLETLPSGTKLTLLNKSKTTGYSKVRTSKGLTGYILTRFTSNKPASRWLLDNTKKNSESLKAENDKLKKILAGIQDNNSNTASKNVSLTTELDQITSDLSNLRQTASNAIQIQRERNELQERVVTVERELQQLKRAKQALEDSTSQDWFLYGGILSFLGIFFGLMIPKISWHRKSQSNWDTF